MKEIPKDWKQDQDLWKLLDTHSPKTSVHFNYQVRQKINEQIRARQRARRTSLFSALKLIYQSWSGATVAIATACITVTLVLWQSPVTHHSNTKGPLILPQKGDPIELPQIVQNFDLIQNLDVIQHLDELASSN